MISVHAMLAKLQKSTYRLLMEPIIIAAVGLLNKILLFCFCMKGPLQPAAQADDLLLFFDIIGFFFADQFQCFYHIEAAVCVLPHTDFSFQPAVLFTVGQAEIISCSAGKPADFFSGIFFAQVTSGGGYYPVFHGL